jgi:hypothetical protein
VKYVIVSLLSTARYPGFVSHLKLIMNYVVSGMLLDAQQVLCWIQEMELHMLCQFMKALLCLIAS